MMILGISAGRSGGITGAAVRAVLDGTGMPGEFISLSDKTLSGCTGCLACASDNRCKLRDDFLPISEKMLEADAIVFGSPCYYNGPNARVLAVLERAAYSFHHNSVYSIGEKPYVSVSTEWIRKVKNMPGGDPVEERIRYFLERGNRMRQVGHVTAQANGCCYECGYGHACEAGGAITEKSRRIGGFEPEDMPPTFDRQLDTQRAAGVAADALREALRHTGIKA